MEKSNLQLVMDDLNRKGLKFTTFTAWSKKLMQDPEFRKLHEVSQRESEKNDREKNRISGESLLI